MTSNIDYTDDTLSYVITDGIRFLQSLTQHYGAERGMEVWEKLGEVMGPEIKGQVFFSMLTGETPTQVRIRAGSCTEAVAAIKAIRNATKMGLKEAKDVWDLSKTHEVLLKNVQREIRSEFVHTLRNLGMIAT
jgi:ribosomal protein L7/L12